VNDNSPDGTYAAVQSAGVTQSVKAILRDPTMASPSPFAPDSEAATGDYLLVMDTDFRIALTRFRSCCMWCNKPIS